MSHEHAEFARRLHRAMQAKNLTQSQLAEAVWGRRPAMVNGQLTNVATNRDRIHIYLTGKGFPRANVLAKLASALDTTPEALAPNIAAPGEKLPAPVTLAFLDRDGGLAKLQVDTVLPADVAMEVMALINKARKESGDD